jgi:hypothetical protein
MRTERRAFHAVMGALLAGLLVLAEIAMATPEEATWRRQTLLGQNAEHFFRYVTASVQPGSYYAYSLSLRLEKVRKSDLRVVESVLLRDVSYSQHPDSVRWSETSAPVPPFDLPRYLKANRVAMAFADDLIHYRTFAIDSAGVWEVFEDGREQLATRKELERQIPALGDDPRVVGIEGTAPRSGRDDWYLRIESGSSDLDTDWSEDLLIIRGDLH